MRSVLSIVLLIATSVVPRLALARCSPELDPLEVKVTRADFIVVAWVREAEATRHSDRPTEIRAEYEVAEVLKGSPPPKGVVTSRLTTAGIQLTPGLTYLFFLYGDSFVGPCGGSRRLDWYTAQEAGFIGEEAHPERDLLRAIRELVERAP
jgi:hypothetical protein